MTTKQEQDDLWTSIQARLTDKQKVFVADVSKRALGKSSQELAWVQELDVLTDLIAQEQSPTWPVVRLFWIRLHGALTELSDKYEERAKIADGMSQEQLESSALWFSLPVHHACCALMASLEEPEVVLVDYFRQYAAHLHQDSYAMKMTKGGGLRDSRTFSQIDKQIPVEEVDRIRKETMAAHGSEAAFANHIARKVQLSVGQLRRIIDSFHKLPELW